MCIKNSKDKDILNFFYKVKNLFEYMTILSENQKNRIVQKRLKHTHRKCRQFKWLLYVAIVL